MRVSPMCRSSTAALARTLVGALAAVLAVALAGCTAVPSHVVDGSVVTVGLVEEYTGSIGAGATIVDQGVMAATLAGFSVVEASGRRTPDTSFGVAVVLSSDPLVVRYTVADGLRWSDGAPIDGVDLLLDWAARSGRFASSGFGARADVLASVGDLPELSADRKSLTLTYQDSGAEWLAAFSAPLPAHVVAGRAFGVADADAASDAVIAAVTAAIVPDAAADGPLTDLAAAWRTAWEPPGDGEPFLVASGPFQLARIAEGSVELEANPLYSGQRRPSFERVVLWTFGDQLAAVQALQDGLVQAIQVGANDATTDAITRIRADARPLFPSVGAPQLAAWHHREILGVDPGALGAGVLWNLWAWAPAASQGVPEEASAAVGFPQSARAGSH